MPVAHLFADLLAVGRPIPADGAMGSALIALGLPAGMPPEAWLLTPDGALAAGAVHAGHAAAGARIVLTATFGASPVRLADGTAAGRTVDVCRAAVVI
ncbi:MAG TPA: homocysteine S-methyltransferase family protein, partial [Patescibacteria group bacterium]|nr:homocysteine S-methyltransferase family protein [Patescibacteria group bacterium]